MQGLVRKREYFSSRQLMKKRRHLLLNGTSQIHCEYFLSSCHEDIHNLVARFHLTLDGSGHFKDISKPDEHDFVQIITN
ncbi:MAG: hypothetical protein ACTSYS_01370 [Promethearchaeota archaeon]